MTPLWRSNEREARGGKQRSPVDDVYAGGCGSECRYAGSEAWTWPLKEMEREQGERWQATVLGEAWTWPPLGVDSFVFGVCLVPLGNSHIVEEENTTLGEGWSTRWADDGEGVASVPKWRMGMMSAGGDTTTGKCRKQLAEGKPQRMETGGIGQVGTGGGNLQGKEVALH